MLQLIVTIRLGLPLRMGSVNCYLLDTGSGFVLVDTGGSNRRRELVSELEKAGCQPGALKLIAITHGDFDHTGNAAYLRQRYAAPIAMHAADRGMAEQADMFYNRSQGNALLKALVPRISGFRQSDRFTPDLTLEEGFDLSAYGLDARVVAIPGHSKGSIGVLTASGELFCGDLLANTEGPGLSGIMDDPATARISLEKLRGLAIQMVYPGHGEPFKLDSVG